MAITDVRVLRSLQLTQTKGDKGTIQYSATEEYLILSSTKNPFFGDILESTESFSNLSNRPLPQINDELQVNGVRFYVTSRELSYYKDNERAVVMKVRFDAKDVEGEDQPDPPQDSDPSTWQRITIQSQQLTEPAKGWVTLNAATQQNEGQDTPRNSAGDPVDGLEEDTALVRLTYTNTQVTNPNFSKLQEYTNQCNSTPFLGGIEYTVRCTGWSGEFDQRNNVWSISVEFLYKPNDWSIEFYDVGFNEIVDDERRAILDVAGNPVSKPVPLDGNGHAAAITSSETGPTFQPVDLSFRYLFPYPAVDLSNIFDDCRI